MITDNASILTINGGSSSIKFSLYKSGKEPALVFQGEMTRIGQPGTQLQVRYADHRASTSQEIAAGDQDVAGEQLVNWLLQQPGMKRLAAIGHRVVHGMQHAEPAPINPALLEELKKISAFDPDHLPAEIRLIEMFRERFPDILQVACFDTSFHATMPTVAKLLPLPRKFAEKGIQRYGFHGLSYAYLVRELDRIEKNTEAKQRVVIAHLGSGASLAAIRQGKSIDSSMGFTPASGVPMSTRTGDLDPGIAWYIMQSGEYSPEQFSHLINKESGLLGVSAMSADMKELLAAQQENKAAAEAIELFCYQVKKYIGAYAAALGGIDTLLFAGGIGEKAPEVRSRICSGLAFLGIVLDEKTNGENGPVISTADARVCVRVIKTNEELMIAGFVNRFLMDNNDNKK